MHMRAKAALPARNSRVLTIVVTTEELRRRFVNVSQRIGLLLVRSEQFVERPPAAAKRDELFHGLEAEHQNLKHEIQLLWDEKFERGHLLLFREKLGAAVAAAKDRMNALKMNEGA